MNEADMNDASQSEGYFPILLLNLPWAHSMNLKHNIW